MNSAPSPFSVIPIDPKFIWPQSALVKGELMGHFAKNSEWRSSKDRTFWNPQCFISSSHILTVAGFKAKLEGKLSEIWTQKKPRVVFFFFFLTFLPIQSSVSHLQIENGNSEGANLSKVTWLVSGQNPYLGKIPTTGMKYVHFSLRSNTTVLSLPGVTTLSTMLRLMEKENISNIYYNT